MGKILVVDDENDICQLLVSTLRKRGFETSYSLTIKGALNKLSEEPFDLVFVDLNLTDGSGYDLINWLIDSKIKVKFIVISAFDSERQKVLATGAEFFIPKPFSKKAILEAIDKIEFA